VSGFIFGYTFGDTTLIIWPEFCHFKALLRT